MPGVSPPPGKALPVRLTARVPSAILRRTLPAATLPCVLQERRSPLWIFLPLGIYAPFTRYVVFRLTGARIPAVNACGDGPPAVASAPGGARLPMY